MLTAPSSAPVDESSQLNGVPDLRALTDRNGVTWRTRRRDLRVRHTTILGNVLLAWVMIAAGVSVFGLLRSLDAPWLEYLALPFGGLWFAFWIQAYTAHFHEAAHFNLAANRRLNDLLANLFLTPFTGLSVKDYRISHWEHHKFLGDPRDTEISYHAALVPTRILESFTGVYLVRSLARYLLNYRRLDEPGSKQQARRSAFFGPLVYAGLVNAGLLYLLWQQVSIAAALAWGSGVVLFGSLLSILRQTLEHRALDAPRDVDFKTVSHGSVNRLFGGDFFSRHFGGAGFNRHLLHHWDPGVSYTRFDDMEQFLRESELGPVLASHRSTYWESFKAMFEWR